MQRYEKNIKTMKIGGIFFAEKKIRNWLVGC